MKVKIVLHGHLRTSIQRDFLEVEATTLFEALNGIAQKYRKELKAPLDIGRWKIRAKGYDSRESWFVPLFTDEVHIYPIFKTAKSNWVTMGIGAALMVVGAVTAYLSGWSGVGAWAGAFIFSTGLSMLTSGVMAEFFMPKMNTSDEASTNSKYLGVRANTTQAGTRIPFGYGLYKVSGQYLSYNVTSSLLRTI